VALFKTLHQTNPELAKRCYRVAESHLVADREFAICASYIPDAQARFEEIRQLFQMKIEIAEKNPRLQEGGIKEYAEASLVAEVGRLIEILVGVGRGQEAERVRDLALELTVSAETREALDKALAQEGH
jgi:hypothetical protein